MTLLPKCENEVAVWQKKIETFKNYFAIPRKGQNEYFYVDVKGLKEYDLISGWLDIYLDSDYIRRCFLNVDKAENLKIDLGRVKGVKINSRKVADEVSSKKLQGKIIRRYKYIFEVTNNLQCTIALRLYDRIPVSQVDGVEVMLNRIDDVVLDEATGKCTWDIKVKPLSVKEIAFEKDMTGKKVLVTAGATVEAIDPVRFITNHSSGKMGFALAKNAMLRGADVTLVMGKCDSEPPVFVNTVKVQSAKDMYDAVIERADSMDIIVKAAAVADYRPKNVSSEKVKKQDGNMSIELERTDDILKTLGERKNGQFICGFSMETENMLENSRKKLEKKNCDMIVANNLKQDGAGFGGNTNIVTLITKDDEVQLEKMTKDEVAEKIFDFILSR